MMAGKTGALFGISALSGALIGRKKADEKAPEVQALLNFAESCGIAFQLQDDILGITSTRETLGKPIGSDIREGKPTLLLLSAYQNATSEEKEFLRNVVGISKDENLILQAREILIKRGGVTETEKKAAAYLESAKKSLEIIPASPYRDLLEAWRDFMLHREY
jgi:geranylgeranyl diphosphate synthase type I